MRVRNIRIAIKSEDELFNEIKNVAEKIGKGEKVKRHEGISFESLDAMRKVLTEERLRILKTIKRENPSSIYGLAKILKRDVKNTFNDVTFLAGLGLIELKKKKDGRKRTMPIVSYEKVLLEITV